MATIKDYDDLEECIVLAGELLDQIGKEWWESQCPLRLGVALLWLGCSQARHTGNSEDSTSLLLHSIWDVLEMVSSTNPTKLN